MESELYLIDHNANNLSSPLHSASFFSKLVLGGVVVPLILFSVSPPMLLFFIAFEMVLMGVARLPVLKLLSWSVYPLVFILVFVGSQLGSPGIALLSLLRAYAMLLFTLLIINTTPYPLFFESLSGVSSTLSSMGFLTYRFFFVLVERLSSSLSIARVRGGRGVGMLSSIIGALLLSAIDRAERVYDIMVVRGYQGRVRTLSGTAGLGPSDAIIVLCAAVFVMGGFLLW